MSDIQTIKSVASIKESSNIETISSVNNISKVENYKSVNNEVEELSLNEEPSLFDSITQAFLSTGATITTSLISIGEGVGKLGEGIFDFGVLAGTAIISPAYFIVEKILGKEGGYNEITKEIWDETKSFVSINHVSNAFDSFYKNDEFGSYLKENSYGFDTVRSIGTNVGKIAGVIALSMATCGVAGLVSAGSVGAATAAGSVSLSTTLSATYATMNGIGTSTAKAWNEGASTLKGIAYGTVHGIWEGAQWIAGGKIGEIGNAGVRVVLDGVNGALDSIIQPAMQAIYSNKTFKELWDENGGIKSLLINTGTALGVSTLSEVSDLRKSFMREQNVDSFVEDIDTEIYARSYGIDEQLLDQKISRYNELRAYQRTDNYINSEISSELGYVQDLRQANFNQGVNQELKQLENEFDALGISYNKDTQIISNIQKESIRERNSIPEFDPNIVKEDVSSVIDVMKEKYGLEKTKKILERFFETGDYNMITRDGNAREIFRQHSIDEIKIGYDLSKGLLEPSVSRIGVGKTPLKWGPREEEGFNQVHNNY